MTNQVPSAATAARELSAVLLVQADGLASDDLPTVSTAMSAVRAAARGLREALDDRGWGTGVLYGFGDPLDEDDLDDADDLDGDADADADEEFEDEEPWIAPAGTRMSWQARYDYVITDGEAFLRYVERRVREADEDEDWARDLIDVQGPASMLAYLDSFGSRDFEGTGMVFAGGQETVAEVARTLFELDFDASEDAFPSMR